MKIIIDVFARHLFRAKIDASANSNNLRHAEGVVNISSLVRSICGLVVLVCAGTLFGAELPSLAINDVSISEGDHGVVLAVFTVSLSVPAAEEVSVRYATIDGSAKAGLDYTFSNGVVKLAPGDTAAKIVILVESDVSVENNREFFIELSDPKAATSGRMRGTGTIIDDDGGSASK